MEIEILKQYLDYKPEEGKLYWKKRSSNSVALGSEAGKKNNDRYARIQIKGKNMLAHRVVWALHYGYWPNHIDHINGDTFDNRITNLRSVSAFENSKNKQIHRDGKKFGAHFTRNKWHASLNVKGKSVHIGVFETEAEAVAAVYGYCKGADLKEHL